MSLAPELVARLRRFGLIAFVAGLAGALVCFLGYRSQPQLFAAYLTAFMFWLGIALGSMGLVMLHGLTGGGWGVAVRRVLETSAGTLPLMAILFLPIGFEVKSIYPWAKPGAIESDEILRRKEAYLNVEGFYTRAAICFAVWILLALLLNLLSPGEQFEDDSPRDRRRQRMSGFGFILYGLSLTVAVVDWVMSLEPDWYSTMYGVVYLGGQAIAGMCFTLLVVAALHEYEPWSRLATPERFNDLGNLLLAFVMFWAYASFMQYLIIWCGNLPEENVWYLHRSKGGWQVVVAGLMGLHFAVPFLLLLSRGLKRRHVSLARVAVLLLAMRYIDLYWLVVPAFDNERSGPPAITFHWLNLAAMVAIGGIWLAVFAWRLPGRAAMPIFDPPAHEAHHERPDPAAVGA